MSYASADRGRSFVILLLTSSNCSKDSLLFINDILKYIKDVNVRQADPVMLSAIVHGGMCEKINSPFHRRVPDLDRGEHLR